VLQRSGFGFGFGCFSFSPHHVCCNVCCNVSCVWFENMLGELLGAFKCVLFANDINDYEYRIHVYYV